MANHKIKSKKDTNITVIIPSAGEGRRMKSYGPKSLIDLRKENILQRQIRIINKVLDNVSFIIVAGFDCDKLMDSCPDYFLKLENESYDITNVSRSIALALRAVKTERVLIVYGDLVFNELALSRMDYSTPCTSASNDKSRPHEVGCIVGDNGNMVSMMYDLETKWNQILYLEGNELRLFKKICQERKNKKLFGFEILNKVIDCGGKIKCIVDDSIEVVDIDTSKDLLKANNIK
jgi:choline kinase